MKKFKFRCIFFEEVLGTMPANESVYSDFVASKAPNAATREEEVAALGADAVDEKGMTVFPRDEAGRPFLYDYQIKGFFKDACGALRKADGTESAKLKAYKKEIDGLVFLTQRKVVLQMPTHGEVGVCQRPLRASTAQGERVALASSETVPAGTVMEFEVAILKDGLEKCLFEWMSYGALRGIGQWRNSGKGRFRHELVA